MNWFSRFLKPHPQRGAGSFGYAVVGLGHIAGYFMDDLRGSAVSHLAAVVSSGQEKAQRTAAKRGAALALTYDDFDTLCDHPEVQAVYLALPVSMHLDFTRRAAAAGKHVLCEKPMASSADEARAMIAACSAAGVRLSIAYRCPYDQAHRQARHLLRSGALGPKQSLRMEGHFGFELKPGWRDDPALAGGGSLFDVGIYPLNAARFLLGEEPEVREATAVVDARGLEREVRWTDVFPSGAELRGWSSYREDIGESLRITGERGFLLLDPAFGHRRPIRLQGELDGEPLHVGPQEQPPHFRMEADALALAVKAGQDTATPGEDGLADMVAMEAIYRSAAILP